MKKLLPTFCVLIIFTLAASAQELSDILRKSNLIEDPGLPIKEVAKHIGSNVYIRDTISGYKEINDTLKLLYVGGKYPKQTITIIFKGKRIDVMGFYLNNTIGHFSGNVIIYEGKPAIVITSPEQLSTAIQI